MRLVLWFSVILAFATYICGPILDPDLWWHITVGRWIVANGTVPMVDHWNLFGAGIPWRAYSWSNEVVVALVDGMFGDRGLIVTKLLLAVFIAATFGWVFSKTSQDWFFGGLLGLYATIACFNHFTLRPQSLVWALFALLLCQVDRVAREGVSRRALVSIFLIMAVWANTHLTTFLGVIAAAGWLLGVRSKRDTVAVCLAAFLGTLITPYFGGEWLTFLAKTDHPFSHGSIAEFQPAHILQYSTGFVLLLFLILALFLHMRPRIIDPVRLIVAGVFLLGGLAVTKFLPFAVIEMCMLLAVLWRECLSRESAFGNLGAGIERLRAFVYRFPARELAFVFVCMAVVNVMKVWRYPVSYEITPAMAMDYIIDKKLPKPLLNDFGKGGYVMYRLSDLNGVLLDKVPIDGRTNVNSPEIWFAYMDALKGTPNWRRYLELVTPQTILWKRESPFGSLLLASGEWCDVFSSGDETRGYQVLVTREYFNLHRSEFSSSSCGSSYERQI